MATYRHKLSRRTCRRDASSSRSPAGRCSRRRCRSSPSRSAAVLRDAHRRRGLRVRAARPPALPSRGGALRDRLRFDAGARSRSRRCPTARTPCATHDADRRRGRGGPARLHAPRRRARRRVVPGAAAVDRARWRARRRGRRRGAVARGRAARIPRAPDGRRPAAACIMCPNSTLVRRRRWTRTTVSSALRDATAWPRTETDERRRHAPRQHLAARAERSPRRGSAASSTCSPAWRA